MTTAAIDDPTESSEPDTKKRGRGPGRPYPNKTVVEAAAVAQAISEHNASNPMNRLLLADAMDLVPSGTLFRDLVTASGKYGFTKGNYNSDYISLTPRGELLVSRSPGGRLEALRQALRSVPVFDKALAFYANNRLPGKNLLTKAVQQPVIGVDAAWASEFADVFPRSAREVGFLRDVSGTPHILLEAGPPSVPELQDDEGEDEAEAQREVASGGLADGLEAAAEPEQGSAAAPSRRDAKALQFFVAHGSNHVPLDQLKQILQQFGIPFVVAQDEPNAGRPISQKIKDLMDDCTGGIFIFSADEEFKDKEGNAIWRPRENVVFELGAASYLYGRSIVIFKEANVTFPSDFRDLGWITFERDRLEAKAMDLMKELIALGALRLVAGA
jgi:predicted nucleotide-binding protein